MYYSQVILRTRKHEMCIFGVCRSFWIFLFISVSIRELDTKTWIKNIYWCWWPLSNIFFMLLTYIPNHIKQISFHYQTETRIQNQFKWKLQPSNIPHTFPYTYFIRYLVFKPNNEAVDDTHSKSNLLVPKYFKLIIFKDHPESYYNLRYPNFLNE